ncbi:hypothetical protein Y900_030175 [Mycolicibacterium aromaticivorans JS19b1 = JCM 16368]|uniref:Uncharacterized protein n=1 Tax=Mycolicibacterium aromaticivorans JS19b1 = JCM 16368 TaxID=1440774 RepID=A0A064CDV5_9MYCO|nr:hypothetical protein [Mycolicibacterium aromaticivorans]KDE96903.1 hypothetical protein Y900_030175 [Mycolicibacterium aromaticivorans JS19b1 = JCM 16368]
MDGSPPRSHSITAAEVMIEERAAQATAYTPTLSTSTRGCASRPTSFFAAPGASSTKQQRASKP